MYRRILLGVVLGLSLSACVPYYAGSGYYPADVYAVPGPYYYYGYFPYYYGGYYAPRYYRPYYYGGHYYGHGGRYYGGYRGGHHW